MKIHQTIKNRRVALGLTQEQLADYLGVSTPAVNKWERNVSYPDITLLPPLARLLKIDLNELLSFENDLSDKELVLYLNEVASTAATDGFLTAHEKGMDYVHKYPTCYKLILNLAVILQGSLYMYAPNEAPAHLEKIEQLYERCLKSEDVDIRYQTISMMTSNCISAGQFDKAQEYLDKIPNIQFDKRHQQGLLFIKRKELDSASKLYEHELISAANKINTILLSMMEIALLEGRSEDALYFTKIAADSTQLFDLWEYNKFANYFQLYNAQKDADNFIKTLKQMLPALEKPWDISNSRLYAHIDQKSNFAQEHQQMADSVINILQSGSDVELDFVKDNPEFKLLMQKYR